MIWLLPVTPKVSFKYRKAYNFGEYTTSTVCPDHPVGTPYSVTCIPCAARKLAVRTSKSALSV
ncbi:MAG: hypothetical protein HY865_24755 [Chloroflexi bacterium]|nr:hypothetical protein [Chloroflexota bacterium]